jgi:hypothetical protein
MDLDCIAVAELLRKRGASRERIAVACDQLGRVAAKIRSGLYSLSPSSTLDAEWLRKVLGTAFEKNTVADQIRCVTPEDLSTGQLEDALHLYRAASEFSVRTSSTKDENGKLFDLLKGDEKELGKSLALAISISLGSHASESVMQACFGHGFGHFLRATMANAWYLHLGYLALGNEPRILATAPLVELFDKALILGKLKNPNIWVLVPEKES